MTKRFVAERLPQNQPKKRCHPEVLGKWKTPPPTVFWCEVCGAFANTVEIDGTINWQFPTGGK